MGISNPYMRESISHKHTHNRERQIRNLNLWLYYFFPPKSPSGIRHKYVGSLLSPFLLSYSMTSICMHNICSSFFPFWKRIPSLTHWKCYGRSAQTASHNDYRRDFESQEAVSSKVNFQTFNFLTAYYGFIFYKSLSTMHPFTYLV